jgi:uncharacterized repeat protein (TIGR02543 family)
MNTLSKNRNTARSVVAVLTAAALLVSSWFAFPLINAAGNGGNSAFEVYADVSDYNASDVAVINAIIENNGLNATKDDPAGWDFATWNDNAQDKRITELNLWGRSLLSGTLNVSGLTSLEWLDCSWSELTALDVSGLSALESLNCSLNELTSLTVTGCTALATLDCGHNYLTLESITGLNDTALDSFALNNQDSQNVSDYNTNDIAVINAIISTNGLNAPQNAPREWRLFIDWEDSVQGKRITKLKLEGSDRLIGTLDVSGLSSLKTLLCRDSNFTGLNVSGLTSLESFDCYYNNKLTTLDVSGLTSLESLHCYYNNKLTTLDVSGLTSLKELDCEFNELTSLTVTGCTSLSFISCERNFLSKIIGIGDTLLNNFEFTNQNSKNVSDYNAGDVAVINAIITTNEWDMPQNEPWEWRESIDWEDSIDGKRITELYLWSWPDDLTGTLDVSGLSLLRNLSCSGLGITGLNVSGLTSLSSLYCSNNRLTSLDVSGLTSLSSLYCSDNELTSINVTNCSTLRYFSCANNYLSSESAITGFDSIKSNVTDFEFGSQDSLDISAYSTEDMAVINQIISENGLNATPSAVAKWDFVTWEDSAGGKRITELSFIPNYLTFGRINGILDISGLTSLRSLSCEGNKLTGLNALGLTSLEYLHCSRNELTDFNVSGLTSLEQFNCESNKLTSIDVTGCTALEWLHCADNDLPSQSAIIGLDSIRNNLTSFGYSPQNVPQIMTVTFDPNGGDTLSSDIASKPVTQGETYGALPTPTCSGYTFAGWFTAATNGSKITSASEVTETTNHTLYAQWTAVAPPPVNPPYNPPPEDTPEDTTPPEDTPEDTTPPEDNPEDTTLPEDTPDSPATDDGWVKNEDGVWQYITDGEAETGWVKDKNTWYYLAEDGAMQTGWAKDENTWYYLAPSGAMQTGWVRDKNAWYYLASNGKMQIGWVKDKNSWYYLAGNGAMVTGWVKDKNTWYYLAGNGKMLTGKQTIGGKTYTFKANGAWVG